MKKYVIGSVIATFLIFPLYVIASSSNIDEVVQLPKGLEAYYPPKTDGPFYLFRMLDLEGAFSGIAAELEENDLKGARDLFKVFKTEYSSVKKMVDEWKKDFPDSEIFALETALDGTNKDLIFSAFGEMGKVCHRCHEASMVATQQKYRWGNFSELDVRDVENGEKKPYAVFKKFLAVNMAGVRVDASQGQWDGARKHFSTLKGRFALLTNSCTSCHVEEPKYFVNPDSLPLLENELGKNQPDNDKVDNLIQKLGGESCAGCHLIHVPAAMASANYDRTKEDQKE
jgi:cytochrome c556